MRITRLSLVASVFAVLAMPASAAGQAPVEDSVVGSGTLANGFSFEVDARSGPSGKNPHGTFVATARGVRAEFSVVCLQVTGTTAVVGANLGIDGGGVLFQVVDGSPDTIAGSPLLRRVQPQDCQTPPADLPQPFTSGSVVVTDAQPLPRSKEQCKNGGWQSFGIFKNQGDCVSFVATGGRNQPSGH
jgi:hypothetical protein